MDTLRGACYDGSMTTEGVVRFVAISGAIGYLIVGVWAAIFLAQGRWIIGSALAACILVGVPALVSCVRSLRRPPDDPGS